MLTRVLVWVVVFLAIIYGIPAALFAYVDYRRAKREHDSDGEDW